MRLMMVQVPTSHLGAGERVYPLGLARLSGLVPADHTKWVLDLNCYTDPWPEFKKQLEAARPDVVALSFRNMDPLAGIQTSYLPSLRTAAKVARLTIPRAQVWAGGPAFSLFAERLMDAVPEIDRGIIGEGETAFEMLLKSPDHLRQVPGMVWRREGKVTVNPLGARLPLERLPELDTAGIDPQQYMAANTYVAAFGIEGKRGCDLRCSYCVYPKLGGDRMRLRPPEHVAAEMEQLHKSHGVTLFHFTDAVVNRPADHFQAVCRAIIQRRLKIEWTGFFREDSLSGPQLDLALRAGLVAIYFSADGMTDQGLRILAKRMTKSQIIEAARLTASRRILTIFHFLVNLPGEKPKDFDEARETLDRILDIHAPAGNLGAVVFNTVRLYPGAPMTNMLQRRGCLDPGADLLFPFTHDPPEGAHIRHVLEAHCQTAGVISRLGLTPIHSEGIAS